MVAASLEPCLAMAEQRSKRTKKGIFNRCTPDIQAFLTDFNFKRATFVKAWKPDSQIGQTNGCHVLTDVELEIQNWISVFVLNR